MNEKIKNAVFILIIIIVIYVVIYATLFYINKNHFQGIHTFIDILYFTTTTQSTLGYGDMTAKSQLAKFIVICQSMTILLFLIYISLN